MNPLGLIGMGTAALAQVGKFGLGLGQLIKGAGMRPRRPNYEIPDEQFEKLNLRRANLNARMAGAARMEENMRQGGATAMNNVRQGATSSAAMLSAAGANQAQQNRSFENLQGMEEQAYQGRLNQLGQAQSEMSGYRDKAFQLNEMDPYLDEARTKSALLQGGITNTYNSLMDMSSSAGNAQILQQMNPGLFNLFPRKQNAQVGNIVPEGWSPQFQGTTSVMDGYKQSSLFPMFGRDNPNMDVASPGIPSIPMTGVNPLWTNMLPTIGPKRIN